MWESPEFRLSLFINLKSSMQNVDLALKIHLARSPHLDLQNDKTAASVKEKKNYTCSSNRTFCSTRNIVNNSKKKRKKKTSRASLIFKS